MKSNGNKKALHRSTFREIRGSFGRFFAIFAIIALGVGFFSGVRITTPAMVHTFDLFFEEKNLYDYKLMSTVGWETEDVEYIRKKEGVQCAEGSKQYDVICLDREGADKVYKAHSLTKEINQLELREGRFPETAEEVLLDNRNRGNLKLGDQLVFSENCPKENADHFRSKSYTIVGFADSSLYINFERGTTSLGNGLVSGFLYLTEDAFREDIYTEIYVDMDVPGGIYTEEYDDAMDLLRPTWEKIAEKAGERRLKRIVNDPQNLLMVLWGYISGEEDMSVDTFLMERNTNIGYVCFQSDSQIVEQVARIFPIFFILVAALVCMTTMTRMVEEQRGQIGILKALGYSDGDILMKYISYSGSASILGCIIGYSVGIILFPSVIYITYNLMYISLPLQFVFDWKLALISLMVSVLCSVGITWLAVRVEQRHAPAMLMRPKAPKPGKRVFLERIPAIWNHLKFLHKVSVRNIFRYKGRFFMMVLGISGCTALLLTGFGLKDSIRDFARMQFEEIQTSDLELNFKNGDGEKAPEELESLLKKETEDYILTYNASWDLIHEKTVKSVSLIVPDQSKDFTEFFRLMTTDGEILSVPKKGETLISVALSERYHLKTGDTVTLRSEDLKEVTVTITGVIRNHIYNYVIASPEDIPRDVNTAYVRYAEGTDINQAQTTLAECGSVTYVDVYGIRKERFTNMMSSLDYIVLVVILSAAGLAFVVLYNLTNINITERIREIATIKVLGFYPNETAQYVFRENIVLTFFGMLAGLGLGILLHRFVMTQIIVDMVYFNIQILPMSFLYSFALTLIFTVLVNLFMRRKLERINMAESLKSVE